MGDKTEVTTTCLDETHKTRWSTRNHKINDIIWDQVRNRKIERKVDTDQVSRAEESPHEMWSVPQDCQEPDDHVRVEREHKKKERESLPCHLSLSRWLPSPVDGESGYFSRLLYHLSIQCHSQSEWHKQQFEEDNQVLIRRWSRARLQSKGERETETEGDREGENRWDEESTIRISFYQ